MRIFWNLLFVVIPVYTFSQSNWRNAVITLRDGTVVSGQVYDLEWESAPKEIEFRKEGQAPQKFSVDDIVSFATDRPVRYESHTVAYDDDLQDVGSLTKNKEPINFVREKLFLEVKVNAAIALLYLKGKNGRRHFFLKEDTTLTELLNRNYLSGATDTEVATNERYKQQLVLITNECPEIQSGLKRLTYNENRLTDVIKKINACKDNKVDPIWAGAINTEKKKSNFGIVVQAMASSCNYPFYFEAPVDGINIGGGLFWELYSRKRPTKVSFYNEITYKKILNEKGSTYIGEEGDLECTKIKLVSAVKLSSPNRKEGRFYAGFGINNGMRSNTVIAGTSKVGRNGDDFSSSYEVGFTGMLGHSFILLQALKVSPEIRYDYEYGVSNELSFSNYSLNLQIGLK